MKAQISALTMYLFATFAMSGQQGLSMGDTAPEFKGLADNGSIRDINKFLGGKYIVVYFNPAAMTGGCT